MKLTLAVNVIYLSYHNEFDFALQACLLMFSHCLNSLLEFINPEKYSVCNFYKTKNQPYISIMTRIKPSKAYCKVLTLMFNAMDCIILFT